MYHYSINNTRAEDVKMLGLSLYGHDPYTAPVYGSSIVTVAFIVAAVGCLFLLYVCVSVADSDPKHLSTCKDDLCTGVDYVIATCRSRMSSLTRRKSREAVSHLILQLDEEVFSHHL